METPTYQDLFDFLKENPEYLQQNITVRLSEMDEYFPVNIKTTSENDVLDKGHLFLEVEE